MTPFHHYREISASFFSLGNFHKALPYFIYEGHQKTTPKQHSQLEKNTFQPSSFSFSSLHLPLCIFLSCKCTPHHHHFPTVFSPHVTTSHHISIATILYSTASIERMSLGIEQVGSENEDQDWGGRDFGVGVGMGESLTDLDLKIWGGVLIRRDERGRKLRLKMEMEMSSDVEMGILGRVSHDLNFGLG